ncbi:elongation factor 1-alpha [Cladophialophora yegresii CBS 114405]|uniref:Elongation factor 1 alpha-like protein n=1 Tax=Cladophialophora yegresii CBS 114405 TaxID=1182544 RepID=W9VQD4_9EURO|nr:elongation factor 1-alpha [Cladophialophora yegresii CBS 114405]EXJ54331.1 elongation factor 1-alpha [Cladophialophora yegresii CBS 114405]
MSNRRVKSLAHDEDDLDDYDDYDDDYEDGNNNDLSPEDKEQMRQGTVKVRTALGSTFPATDSEIQDALWHYYYDVAKSVAYLKNKQKPPPSASKKQVTQNKNFDAYTTSEARFSAVEFFQDSPWLNIPEHRRGEIVIEPLYPRLGLLGGAANAGKMSKLAALAAKRRQKENQPPASEPRPGSEIKEDYLPDLKKLGITASPQAKSTSSEPQALERQAPSTGGEASAEADRQKHTPDVPLVVDQNLRGHPSAFASIMTNHGPESQSLPSTDFPSVKATAKSFNFAEPSPDDIVTKAQSAKASSTTSEPKEPAKSKTTLNNGVQALSIQDTPKIKSKNIDVLAEYKKTKRKNAANFVVIGHVDAGKSTLMGRLLFDLKAIDQRTMEKYRQEAERIGKGSFAFAWVLDQGTEERARGVTIDIATNKFETDKTSFTILDAPGHRDFVPNMIAGASQADFAVLVIDASTGNFESGLKGQTKEHALLVRSIGVQRIIVAVNKMDVADWSQERFTEIRQQMAAFLSSAGFQSKNITFVPCSGLEGGNILTKVTDAKAAWYHGLTLVEELDSSEPLTYALDKALRMTISDIFRHGIQNPLSVSGRLDAGAIQVGEEVVIMPSGEKAQIRSLLVDDEPQDWAVAGQNVILNLTDIDPIHLKSGDVVCSTLSPIRNITECKAKILAFDHLTPMNVDVHKGRLHVPGRISQLVGVLDKSTGAITKKRPKIVQPGSVVRVVVQLDQAVPLEAPARIVLRANGETVGAGLIE